MHCFKKIALLTTLSLIFFACAPDLKPQIDKLEQDVATQYEVSKGEQLMKLYRAYIESNAKNAAVQSTYLTRGAKLAWEKQNDAVTAVHWLNEAIALPNIPRTEPAGLLARIYNAFQYRSAPTMKLQPNDAQNMSTLLAQNATWIDSAMLASERIMVDPTTHQIKDKLLGAQYIEMAEGYGALMQGGNLPKFISLIKSGAKVATDMGNFNKAIQLYETIYREAPEHDFAPTALFMRSFIYENNLNDLPKAKAGYEEFLQKYPNNEMVESARASLKMLGKSPEEIIKAMGK